MFIVMATISQAEHDEDREEMCKQFAAGDRPWWNDDEDREGTGEEFLALPFEVQLQMGEDELGEGWDVLWLYPDGATGGDRWSAARFETHADAEAALQLHWGKSDATFEIVEV